jgi:hypothetical protein
MSQNKGVKRMYASKIVIILFQQVLAIHCE